MKTHFHNKEKELIREICSKLTGAVLDIDNLKAEIAKLISDNNLKIYRNSTQNTSFDYVLDYKDVEIGIKVEIINEYQYKIRDIIWHEF